MFRQRWISTALSMLALITFSQAAAAFDEDAMPQAKAESDAFVKAFNAHNAKAVGALFTETADFAFLQGSSLDNIQFGLVSGRPDITATLETFYQLYPSAKLAHNVRKARTIAPEVMVSDEDFELTGLPADAGPIKGQFVVVRVRANGAWKIAAERNVSKVPASKR